MSDEALRALRREAEASRDGKAWLRVATLLAREARWDEAGLAVLEAEECGEDGGEVLESFAPASFAPRLLDKGPARPGANPRLAWTRDGKELFVAEHAPDGTAGIVAWDMAAKKARIVARNLPVPRIAAFTVDALGRPLLAWTERESTRPSSVRIALVERGFVQPPIGEAHNLTQTIVALGDLVLTGNGMRVKAWSLSKKKPVWESRTFYGLVVGDTGIALGFERKRLIFLEPLAGKTIREVAIQGLPSTALPARRRAVVAQDESFVLIGDGEPTVRDVAWSLRTVSASPSGRHVLFTLPSGLRVLDMREGRDERVEFDTACVAAWSPSGRRLALANPDGELTLYEGQ